MKKFVTLAVAAPLFVLAGCATRGDIDELRSEIAGVRQIAQSADQKATAAQASAAQAAADARLASDKADRIFRSGLRK